MNVDLSKYIKGIKIETAFLPTINIPDPFKPGPPNPLLQFLKPKITLDIAQFGEQEIKPYGDPGQSMWPVIRNVALIFVAGFLLNKLIK